MGHRLGGDGWGLGCCGGGKRPGIGACTGESETSTRQACAIPIFAGNVFPSNSYRASAALVFTSFSYRPGSSVVSGSLNLGDA